jgi:hypothetical protein
MGHYYDVIKAAQQGARQTQKAARAVAKERNNHSKGESKMKNVAGKTRKLGNAYATWTDPQTGWQYQLLKSYQADNDKPYGRWFMAVKSPATFGSFELGDSYCHEMRGSLNKAICAGMLPEDGNEWVRFDESVWEDVGEFIAWAWGER